MGVGTVSWFEADNVSFEARGYLVVSMPVFRDDSGAPHQVMITRLLMGCTGRLLSKPMVERKALICSLEASTGSFNTNHATPSEHGGVVSKTR
jgi:hypothetical protein